MPDWSRHFRVQHTANVMKLGGVVAYPTEAVWGLGCDPYDDRSVQRLLALKHRPEHKGLILLAADIEQFAPFLTEIDDLQRQRLKQTWPGPVTWLVPNNGMAPPWITGRFESVALRVTDHPLAAGLSRAFGGPIVSTSANPQGLPPARTGLAVQRYFGAALDALAPGRVGDRAKPSEIRDLVSGRVCRPG